MIKNQLQKDLDEHIASEIANEKKSSGILADQELSFKVIGEKRSVRVIIRSSQNTSSSTRVYFDGIYYSSNLPLTQRISEYLSSCGLRLDNK